MGTSGSGLFDDDLARDVRGDWRELIGDGLSPEQATDRLVERFAESIADPDDGPVFWIALAMSQWKTGRPVEAVRRQALDVIREERGFERWTGRQRRARASELERARLQLESPPPPAKPIRRTVKSSTPFVAGDVLAYRHADGTWYALWVSGNHTDHGGTYSSVELLDYAEPVEPTIGEAVARPAMLRHYDQRADGTRHRPEHAGFMVLHPSRLEDAERVRLLGNRDRPTSRPTHMLVVTKPAHLDEAIDRVRASQRWAQP